MLSAVSIEMSSKDVRAAMRAILTARRLSMHCRHFYINAELWRGD